MKVLHIYKHFFPDGHGGVAEAIRQICKSTKTYNVDSSVYALSPNPTPRNIFNEDIFIGRSKSYIAPFSCDLGGLSSIMLFRCMAEQSDIIHYHFPWPYADILSLIVRPNKPQIMTWHSDIVRQGILKIIYAPLMNYMLSRMHFVVATSPKYTYTSRTLLRKNVASRTRVICLGMDESSFAKNHDLNILRRIGVDQDEAYFLFVGCTRYYKGLKYLIEASKEIRAKVVIAGYGPELGTLKQEVLKHSVRNVIFTGKVTEDEKNCLLANCRAFVLPSHMRSEAYGMVLVEASIAGKPMVTCEIGTGTSFVNIHNETGFVIKPANPGEISRALNMLLSDGSLAAKMGLAARKRFENNFTGHQMGKAYAQLYNDVLQMHQPHHKKHNS